MGQKIWMETLEVVVQFSQWRLFWTLTEISFPQKIKLTFLTLLILTGLMLLIQAARLGLAVKNLSSL